MLSVWGSLGAELAHGAAASRDASSHLPAPFSLSKLGARQLTFAVIWIRLNHWLTDRCSTFHVHDCSMGLTYRGDLVATGAEVTAASGAVEVRSNVSVGAPGKLQARVGAALQAGLAASVCSPCKQV